jgi:succinate dehydrogenase/fumarate reductase cytochrome b subunit
MKHTHSITWIDPFKTAKIMSGITGVVGLLFGVVTYVTYAFFSYSMQQPGGEGVSADIPPIQSIQLAGILLVFIMYLLAGFFIGYVGALVYNILAKRIGGIEVKLEGK